MLPVQTRALQALGYSLVYIRNNSDLFPSGLSPDELTYVTDVVTKIETINTELLENTRDAMAVKIQDLGLDYDRYIRQTLALQERLVAQLSSCLGVDTYSLAYDNGQTSSMSVQNYY